MHIAVVGGGVVGLAVARQLAKAGASVTVVERSAFGSGCSDGNAGWICPILAAPIAGPGMLVEALRLSLRPSTSPLSIHPSLSPAFLRWAWMFARNTSSHRFERALIAMVALNQSTLGAYDELEADGVSFEMHRTGLLAGARSSAALDDLERSFGRVVETGYRGGIKRLDGDALHELEPAFSDVVAGGLFFPDERHVRPETLISGLLADLTARGATTVVGKPVTGIRHVKEGWRVDLADGGIGADRVVVAAGVGSPGLLAPLGVSVPVQSARGYSITSTGHGSIPSRPLFMPELKVGCSPFGDTVRFVGTFELGASRNVASPKRAARIGNAWARYLRDWAPAEQPKIWAGLRPATPDSLPIVSAVPGRDGLFLATGHGMLGVSLAPVTAQLLAPLVLRNERAPELNALSIERFD